jgi:type VI secretion system secreted protein VgrG
MPPYTLPGERTKSGIKTHSTPGGKVQHFNELRFEDAIGKEEIHLHAENALSVLVEGSESRSIGGTRTVTISNAGKSPPPVADSLTIKLGDRKTTLDKGTYFLTVTLGDSKVDVVQGNEVHTVTAGDFSLSTLAGATKVIGKSVDITGLLKVTISCGASTITLLPALIEIKAPIVKIN